MKTQGSQKFWSVSTILRRSCILHGFQDLKALFLFLVAGTNSGSGNIVEESFFDKYFAEIKGSHDNLKEGFTSFFYLSSRDSIGVHAKITIS